MSRGGHITRPSPSARPALGSTPGAPARAPKLEGTVGGVKLRRPLAATCAILLAATLAVSCVHRPRPAPVDGGAFWPTYLGTVTRAPFSSQAVGVQPPTVLWTAVLSSGIRGMLVVTDEVVVAATADRTIHTLSRQDGSLFWRRRLEGPPGSPVLVGDVIYTATEDKGRLRSIGLIEGDDRWDRRFPSVRTPLALAGDTLYAATDLGSLVAFVADEEEEEPLWQARFTRAPSAGPLVLDRWVVYVAYDSLFVVNRRDGRRQAATHCADILVGEAASDGSRLYLTTERGSLVAWSLPDLELLWKVSGFQTFPAGPVLAPPYGYAVTRSGEVLRFALEDGSTDIIARASASVVAAPTLVRNGLLIGSLSGRLYFFDRDGRPVWDIPLEGSIESPAVVHEGRILVPLYGRGGGALSSGLRGKVVELR